MKINGNILLIVLCIVASISASCILNRHYKKAADKNLHNAICSYGGDRFSFIDMKNIDSIDVEAFHHMDILSRLTEPEDIAFWECAYGDIKSINPYISDVPCIHTFILDSTDRVVEKIDYPFKYGLSYLPYTEEDFERAVEDGVDAIPGAIDRFLVATHTEDKYSLSELKTAVENRYYSLSLADSTDRSRFFVDRYRKFGFTSNIYTNGVHVYFATDFPGFYRVSYDKAHCRREIDFIVILTILLSCSFVIKHFARRK